MNKKTYNIAIIDMNNGHANQGIRGILAILKQFEADHQLVFNIDLFDIRQKEEIPDLNYDAYLSTGGPGSPYEGEGKVWEEKFFNFLDDLDRYNAAHTLKKHSFMICHSFQLACRKYELGQVTRRKSSSFGIFPIYLSPEGEKEKLFQGLNNPLYAVDSRDWQVVQPNMQNLHQKSAEILALERMREHVPLERCLMAIRFSPEMIGTQFHPEADPIGMKLHFQQPEKQKLVIKNYGQVKYQDMIERLDDPNQITLTQKVILPNFLKHALNINP